MTTLVKALFVLMSMVLLSSTAFADVDGKYMCRAKDPATGKSYISQLNIDKTGEIYHLVWVFNDHKTTTANGLLMTHQDTQVLSAVFIAERSATTPDVLKEKHVGLIQYLVEVDGRLVGNWMFSGTTDVGTENCERD